MLGSLSKVIYTLNQKTAVETLGTAINPFCKKKALGQMSENQNVRNQNSQSHNIPNQNVQNVTMLKTNFEYFWEDVMNSDKFWY
jgi:hypothetical protein